MKSADQNEVRKFLSRMGDVGEAETIETHISVVFLYPDCVFKLKKAVRLPYLDFTDPAVRLHYCQRELELNRRSAPSLYRAVHEIVRRADGSLAMDERGELVDAIVEMARFDQDSLFDRLAHAGKLNTEIIDGLARHIAQFHALADVHASTPGERSLRHAQQANRNGFAATELSSHADVQDLLARMDKAIARWAHVLNERSHSGNLRRCHGYLHLRNICLFNGVPTLFDCLEFDEELACIDVLYDLAFLLMDFWQAGQQQNANRLYNRYLDITKDTASLGVMGLFIAMRAAVRAHVAGARCADQSADRDHARKEAHAYIDLACLSLRSQSPRLVAIGGLSGSGKSTAAAAVAPFSGELPGARILSTDLIRKALCDAGPLDRLPQAAYSTQMSARVYAEQRAQALEALRGGASVIADGVFLRDDERREIAAIADQAGVPFHGFWLQAPMEKLVQRVEARRGDPSDATADVVRFQAGLESEAGDWLPVDSGSGLSEVVAAILSKIGRTAP